MTACALPSVLIELDNASTAACAVLTLLMSAVEPVPFATDVNTAAPFTPVAPSARPVTCPDVELAGEEPRLTLKVAPALRNRTPSTPFTLPDVPTSLNAASCLM